MLRFKDFINEKKSLDLHIDMRNNLKSLIMSNVLKSYEIVNDMIKLTFFNEEIVELPLKISEDGKYLFIDGKLWEIIVKYQEEFKKLKKTEHFYHNGKEYPYSKIHDILNDGGCETYNKLYKDFGLQSISSPTEIKNGTISLYYTKPDIAVGNYVPRKDAMFRITKSGNIYQTNLKSTFKNVGYMNSLEDYEKAFKLLYDITFTRYMT